MNKLMNYINASIAEFEKVVWPTRAEGIRLTITVVVFSLILASLLGLFDAGFRTILEKIILKGSL